MLPHYGVFDILAFTVNDGNVTLLGQVTRPTLKSSTENVVKDIEGGVEDVTNHRFTS
jgi:osmotically-inducible protein OsmY